MGALAGTNWTWMLLWCMRSSLHRCLALAGTKCDGRMALACRMRNGLLIVIQLTRLKRGISELSGGVGLCPAGMFCQHNILVICFVARTCTNLPSHEEHKIEIR